MLQLNQQIKQDLINLSDVKYKEFHKGLCPGVNNIIGVRVPVLRKYAKDLLKKYSLKELIQSIDNEYYEEIMLQGMLIGLNSKEPWQQVQEYIQEFIPKIDNWAICDTFCAGLKITKNKEKKMWDFIQVYLKSDKEFEIRFGIVMILDYFIKEEYLERDFEIFDSVLKKDYYVKMAVAWAISICLIKYYNETICYLKDCNLDNFTYQKAIQKAIESYRITKNQKDELRSFKNF